MRSQEGGYVGLVFIGAGFAACVDSQLFQKAIASDPRTTSVGYIVGGLAWFTIPFVLASTYGLAAAALEQLPSWPTYPNRMNSYEVSSGLAMPYAAAAMMGNGGVVAILLMVFMAVTSAMSSETVATTALVTYNIYQAYIKPNASGRNLLYFSHFITVGFAIFCSSIAVAFNHGGFSVGFLITAIGIFVDAAIVPMACTIMWRRQSKLAAFLAPIMGSIAGVIAWFLTAHANYGVISIATLNENLPLVAGNITALGSPLILTPLITLIKPENFDWAIFKEGIKRGDDEQITVHRKEGETPTAALERDMHEEQDNETVLIAARNRSAYLSIFLTLSLVILWPIPMYGTSYIFSSRFYTGWVAFLFIWAFLAAGIIIFLPIWEGKEQIIAMSRTILGSPKKFESEQVTTVTRGELDENAIESHEKSPRDKSELVV